MGVHLFGKSEGVGRVYKFFSEPISYSRTDAMPENACWFFTTQDCRVSWPSVEKMDSMWPLNFWLSEIEKKTTRLHARVV